MDKVFTSKTVKDLLIVLVVFAGFVFLRRFNLNPLDVAVAFVWVLVLIFRPYEYFNLLRRNRVYFMLALSLVGVSLVSILGAYSKVDALKDTVQTGIYLFSTPTLLLIRHNLEKPVKILFVFLSILLLTYSLLFFCTPKTLRLTIFGIHPNAMGFVFSLMSIINISSIPVYVLHTLLVSLTFSRSALLALSVSSFILSLIKRSLKTFLLSILPVILMLVMPVVVKFYGKSSICSVFKGMKTMVEDRLPVDIRITRIYDFDRFKIWKTAMKLFMKRPITGVGAGNFRAAVKEECEKGYLDKGLCKVLYPYENAHNLVLNTMAETGILGILVHIVFWLFVLYRIAINRNYISLSVFMLSVVMSFLHPTVFFIRFMGVIVWYFVLKGVLDYGEPGVPQCGQK